MLARFEQVHPGSAERIFRMGEAEQRHRHEMDREVLAQQRQIIDNEKAFETKDASLQALGLTAAVVVALAFLGVAAFLISRDHDAAGAVVGGATVAAIVTAIPGEKYLEKNAPRDGDVDGSSAQGS